MPQFTDFWTGSQWKVSTANAPAPNLYLQNYYPAVGYLRTGFYRSVANSYATQIWTDSFDATSTWLIQSVGKGLWTIRSAKNGYYVRLCDQAEGTMHVAFVFIVSPLECYQSYGAYPIMVAAAQFDASDFRFLFEIYDASNRAPIVAYSSCTSMLSFFLSNLMLTC
jgi:hypothetical protein